MMTIDIAAIKARHAAATAGEWKAQHRPDLGVSFVAVTSREDGIFTAWREDKAVNAEFCAHAHQDIPALIECLNELAAERDALMQLLAEVRTALHTPDDVDVCEWAAQVAEQAGNWRRFHALSIVDLVEVFRKAAKWDAVPWGGIFCVAHPIGWDVHEDDVVDLRTWYDANKPDGDA